MQCERFSKVFFTVKNEKYWSYSLLRESIQPHVKYNNIELDGEVGRTQRKVVEDKK